MVINKFRYSVLIVYIITQMRNETISYIFIYLLTASQKRDIVEEIM